MQTASSNQFEDLFSFGFLLKVESLEGKKKKKRNKTAPYAPETKTISSATLVLGINFFHEGNTPLQITGQRLHQLQILLNIVGHHLPGVAAGRVQHGGATPASAPAPAHSDHAASHT